MSATAASGWRAHGRPRLTPRAAILAAIVTALLVYLSVPLKTYMLQRERVSQLEQRTELLERRNAILDGRIDRLHDPQYIERLARECLGMARPGEIAFVVVPKPGTSLERPAC